MPDMFYSCSDCPEHGFNIRNNPKNRGEEGEYCTYHNRFFSKSFPMRNSPCKSMLAQADHSCPVCGETLALFYSRKFSYFACEKHGVLQEDGSVIK